MILGKKIVFTLDVLRIDDYTFLDRAHLLALRFVKMTYAFRAFIRINFIDFFALINCIIRAFRLADVTVNAFVGN